MAYKAAAAIGVVPSAAETFPLEYMTQRKGRLGTHGTGEWGIRHNLVPARVVSLIEGTGYNAGNPRRPE